MRVRDHVLDRQGTVESTNDPLALETLTETAQSPEALIEEARQHQRRRRLWVVTVIIILLATALVIGVLMSGGSGASKSGPASSGPGADRTPIGTTVKRNAVDLAATPNGWVPFAFQNAQVSVPSSWLIEGADCGTDNPEQGAVFMGGCTFSGGVCFPNCSNTEPDNWIEFSSLPYPPASYRGHPSYPVNGYAVFESSPCDYQCLSVYDVPSLGVELTGAGATFQKVIHTLSSSPRAVALEPGPAPPIPSSWQRVPFGGLSVAVPRSWPIDHFTFYDDCWFLDNLSDSPSVVLNTGASGVDQSSPSCEDQQGVPTTSVIAAPNGVLIDPGGYRREGTTGSCAKVNGLTVCVVTSDPYGELTLSVQVPGRTYPTAVEIGLAGSGQVARTILYSMEKS